MTRGIEDETRATPDTARALNMATYPGVPASVDRLWGQWQPWDGDLERAGVQQVLDGCAVMVNAMGGGEAWQVTLNNGMTAATDLRRRVVGITTAALADERLALNVRLAVTAGMAVHEAGHGRITRPMDEAVQAAFKGWRLAAGLRLSNIGEDVRLERQTAEDWPAYAGVFPLTLWWVAQRYPTGLIDALPRSRGQAINFAIAAIRYSDHTKWGTAPGVRAERDWWQAWGQRIGAEDEPARHVRLISEALRRIERLPAEVPQDSPSEASQPGESSQPDEDDATDFGDGAPDWDDDDEGWGDDDAQTDNSMGGGQGMPDLSDDEDEDEQAAGGAEGETDEDEADEAAAGSGAPSDQDEAQDASGSTEADAETDQADETDAEADEAGGGGSGAPDRGEADSHGFEGEADEAADRNALDEALPLEPTDAVTAEDASRDGLVADAIRISSAQRESQDVIWVEHRDENDRVHRVPVRIQQPEEVHPYITAPVTSPDIQGMLAAAFVSRRNSHDARTVSRSGRLSGHRVYRAAGGFDNVFMRREGLSADRLDVHLLVDASGSMASPTEAGGYGRSPSRVTAATQMAANIVEALERVATVRTKVWAHNTGGGTSVYDVWDQRRGDALNTLSTIRASGGNNDASAIRAVGQVIADERKPRERSVLVVISDGLPNEDEAMVRGSVEALRAEGIGVISVAIAEGLSETQDECYGAENVVPWEGDWDRLGQGIAEAMGRLA